MDYDLFNIKQFIMLDSGVANTSLTILALWLITFLAKKKHCSIAFFKIFPGKMTLKCGQQAKKSTFS